jgi:hypothetical protein
MLLGDWFLASIAAGAIARNYVSDAQLNWTEAAASSFS